MEPLLDNQAFPGIVDRIVDLAPYESLLRLRAVSLSLQRRADAALLQGRLIVASGGIPDIMDNWTIVSSPHGRIPAFARWDPSWDPTVYVPHTRVSAYPPDTNAGQVTASFKDIRTVDLVGLKGHDISKPSRWVTDIVRGLRDPLTLRFMFNTTGDRHSIPRAVVHRVCGLEVFAADRLVLFMPLPYAFIEEWDRGPFGLCLPSYLLPLTNPPTCIPILALRRILININFHPADAVLASTVHASGRPAIGMRFESVDEAVWLFRRADAPVTVPVRVPHPSMPTFDCAYLLSEVFSAVVGHLVKANAATTVVAPWRSLDGRAAHNNASMTTADDTQDDGLGFGSPREFLARCESCRFWDQYPVDDRAAFLAGITFMTFDEYCAAVGPEDAGLETRESGVLEK